MNTPVKDPIGLSLTKSQQDAYDDIVNFLLDDSRFVHVVQGHSGTGKSTLLRTLIDNYPYLEKTIKLVNPKHKPRDLRITATTNSACDSLASIVKQRVCTIHSLIGVRWIEDYMTGNGKLVLNRGIAKVYDSFICIDEGSYINQELWAWINRQVDKSCKILVLGDKWQLINGDIAPLFDGKYSLSVMTDIVRQTEINGKPHPILELGVALKDSITTGILPNPVIDGEHLIWLPDDQFEKVVYDDFLNKDKVTSKILAYHNKVVNGYNKAIFSRDKGRHYFSTGDTVINNRYLPSTNDNTPPLKTDAEVSIKNAASVSQLDVPGMLYTVACFNGLRNVFVPDNHLMYETALEHHRKIEDRYAVQLIVDTWADLRPVYASTVHKAQGRTLDRVYIDLNNIGKCHDKALMSRLLYVAVTRARHQVVFRGSIS